MIESVCFLFGAVVAFVALWKTDDTNAQIAVTPLALVALFLFVPAPWRLASGLGLLAGLPAYVAFFLYQRGQRAPMPDYTSVDGPAPVTRSDGPTGYVQTAMLPTPSTPDGPYYIPGTPHKKALSADGTAGEPMRFGGQVRTREGQPIRGAAIEIWHADGNGDYDNERYNCRGHQYTDGEGAFAFETVRPFGYGRRTWSMAGLVDYRSAHLHVKIRRDGETFTSQLWFPDDDERNPTDVAYARFRKTNVLALDREAGCLVSRFDFVL